MEAGKIILVLLVSAITAFAGYFLGGLIVDSDAGMAMFTIIGFLIPSVCLTADMHSRIGRR